MSITEFHKIACPTHLQEHAQCYWFPELSHCPWGTPLCHHYVAQATKVVGTVMLRHNIHLLDTATVLNTQNVLDPYIDVTYPGSSRIPLRWESVLCAV